MKYSPYLRAESAGHPENRGSSGALYRPIDRDLERLIALLEGYAERDRSRSGSDIALNRSVSPPSSTRARVERATYHASAVPVLWEPEPDDAPTTLFYPSAPPVAARTIEDPSLAKQKRRHAVWQFFLAFGSAALMVSVLPAALWVAGLLPRNEPHAAAALLPPAVAASPPSSTAAAPSPRNSAPTVAGANRNTPSANLKVSSAVVTAPATAAHPPATTQRAPKVHVAALAAETNGNSPKPSAEQTAGVSQNAGSATSGAPADLDHATRPAAVPTSAPRTDVARSL